MMKFRSHFLIVLMMISFTQIAIGQEDAWATYYEKSGYRETPRYDETVAYCQRLDEASPWVKYTTFGTSPQGRKLPLLIIDKHGYFDPASVRNSGNLVVMVQAGIHAGEPDGKDAMLMLIRDMVIRQEHYEILDRVTFLFIPIFNVDGHERFGPYNRINQDGPEEMGWRTTAQNLNLNRDYLKADAPEMQAWLRLFNAWLPDFFIDIHVTDGADYQYVSTYGLDLYDGFDHGLRNWTTQTLVPAMEQQMDAADYPIFPYVMFRRWHDPRSGLQSGVASPRFSTGYASIQNRIGLLVENHMLKDYKTRVSATYQLIIILGQILNDNASRIRDLNALADNNAASRTFREQELPVSFKQGPDSIFVDFRGVKYDIEPSDLTGGNWFRYHPDEPEDFSIPYFYEQYPDRTVKLPEAYIFPPEWMSVTQRLDMHGIKYRVMKESNFVKVQGFRFHDYSWAKQPYEGRFVLTTQWDTLNELREYPAGSIIVDMNQRTARVIANIFEPPAPDSYLSWGFFNTIFEQKEYYETYVMEEVARKMIEEDPALKDEFEQWKADHPDEAKSQWVQLGWFYQRSPWWDKSKDLYPVGKILDRQQINRLK